MVKKQEVKKIKPDIFLIISFILIVVSSLILFYNYIVLPSILLFQSSSLSVKVACGDISNEKLNGMGYIIAGAYYPPTNQTNNSTPNIKIFVKDDDNKVKRHEYCHYIQFIQGRSGDCYNQRYRKFLNEVECNVAESLSSNVYNKIYPGYI